MKGSIRIDKERCKGCGLCIEFCPKDCISLSEELNLKGYFVATFAGGADDTPGGAAAGTGGAVAANGAVCNGCGVCALICPDVAIEVIRL